MSIRGDAYDNFKRALAKGMGQHMRNELNAQIEFAVVESVQENTCTVQMLTDNEGVLTEGISTMISGNTNIRPKLKSKCLVAHIMNDDSEGLLIWCDEIEGLHMNGDEHGGLCITPKLVTEVNKLKAWMNAVQQAFNSWVVAPSDGGAALKALSTTFTNMQQPDFSQIENKTVKHGGQ